MGLRTVWLAGAALSSALALAKPVVLDDAAAAQMAATAQGGEAIENAQSCSIARNLPDHISYTLKTVIPRIGNEAPELLKPRQNSPGRPPFYPAERIDLGDLFHVHLRYPLNDKPDTLNGKLHPSFKDSRQYHLQYHSFETLQLIQEYWVSELRRIPDPELQDWLSERARNIHMEQHLRMSSNPFRLNRASALPSCGTHRLVRNHKASKGCASRYLRSSQASMVRGMNCSATAASFLPTSRSR